MTSSSVRLTPFSEALAAIFLPASLTSGPAAHSPVSAASGRHRAAAASRTAPRRARRPRAVTSSSPSPNWSKNRCHASSTAPGIGGVARVELFEILGIRALHEAGGVELVVGGLVGHCDTSVGRGTCLMGPGREDPGPAGVSRSPLAPPRRGSAGLSATTMPGGFHRLDLVVGAALAARDDGAGMAHAAARRRGAPGDEARDGLLAALFRLVLEELRRVLFGAPPISPIMMIDLGLVIGEEPFQHVDMLGPLDRVAADADAGGLAPAPHRWSA